MKTPHSALLLMSVALLLCLLSCASDESVPASDSGPSDTVDDRGTRDAGDQEDGDAGTTGCTKDTDCKGDRICENGTCVGPSFPDAPDDGGADQGQGEDSLDATFADVEPDGGFDANLVDSTGDGGDEDGSDPDVTEADGGLDVQTDTGSDGGDADGSNGPVSVVWEIQLSCVPHRMSVDKNENLLFVCDDDNLYSLNKGGVVNWKYAFDIYSPVAKPLIHSTGTVVISEQYRVIGLDEHGAFVWEHAFPTGVRVNSAELSTGGIAIIGFEKNGPFLVVHVVSNLGKLTNTNQIPLQVTEGPSPLAATDDGHYYVTAQTVLLSVNNGGAINWLLSLPMFLSSPVMDWDGNTTAVSGIGGASPALQIVGTDGKVKKKTDLGSYFYPLSIMPPVIDRGARVYYIGSNAYGMRKKDLVAVDGSGQVKWSFNTTDGIWAEPTVYADGKLLVPSMEGILYCLKPDGVVEWSYNMASADLHIPAVVLADKSIVVANRAGIVVRLIPK